MKQTHKNTASETQYFHHELLNERINYTAYSRDQRIINANSTSLCLILSILISLFHSHTLFLHNNICQTIGLVASALRGWHDWYLIAFSIVHEMCACVRVCIRFVCVCSKCACEWIPYDHSLQNGIVRHVPSRCVYSYASAIPTHHAHTKHRQYSYLLLYSIHNYFMSKHKGGLCSRVHALLNIFGFSWKKKHLSMKHGDVLCFA